MYSISPINTLSPVSTGVPVYRIRHSALFVLFHYTIKVIITCERVRLIFNSKRTVEGSSSIVNEKYEKTKSHIFEFSYFSFDFLKMEDRPRTARARNTIPA